MGGGDSLPRVTLEKAINIETDGRGKLARPRRNLPCISFRNLQATESTH